MTFLQELLRQINGAIAHIEAEPFPPTKSPELALAVERLTEARMWAVMAHAAQARLEEEEPVSGLSDPPQETGAEIVGTAGSGGPARPRITTTSTAAPVFVDAPAAHGGEPPIFIPYIQRVEDPEPKDGEG